MNSIKKTEGTSLTCTLTEPVYQFIMFKEITIAILFIDKTQETM